MTDVEHTPAPWYVQGGIRVMTEDVKGSGPQICSITDYARRDEGVKEANARLIAAAPDLKSACKGLLDKLFEVAKKHGDRSVEHDVCSEVRVARKALAKAEGAEQ